MDKVNLVLAFYGWLDISCALGESLSTVFVYDMIKAKSQGIHLFAKILKKNSLVINGEISQPCSYNIHSIKQF